MEVIRRILTRDSIIRKTREWELYPDDLVGKIWNKNYKLRSIASPEFECYVAGKKLKASKKINWEKTKKSAIENICRHSLVEKLLDTFYGKIVLAGGSVFYAIHNIHFDSKDLDFFFIGPKVEHTDILLQVLTFLSSNWINNHKGFVYILRNEFVTSIYLMKIEDRHEILFHKYQFIHRVYPSIAALLNGFDLGPSMIAFTGKDIVTTEFGAWSVSARSIIIDTSRRSTSYEHRIKKYSRICHVIFPGLSKDLVCEEAKDFKDIYEIFETLNSLIALHGYKKNKEGHARCQDLIKIQEKVDLPKLLEKTARKFGFTIENTDELKFKPIETGSKVDTVQDLWKILFKVAYEGGYYIEKEDFIDNFSAEECLFERAQIYKLPYMILDVEQNRSWTIGIPRGKGISYNISDYGDNPVWPFLAEMTNITALSHGNISSVSTILCLKSENDNFNYEEWLDKEEIGHLKINFTNVLSTQNTENVIKESFSEVNLGDLSEALKCKVSEITNSKHHNNAKRKSYALFASQPPHTLGHRIEMNRKEAMSRLKGVKWILENPGRQWTSSINPIIADPRDWYGPSYVSFRIGCYETEITLRIIRRIPESSLYKIDGNLFEYLMKIIIWIESEN